MRACCTAVAMLQWQYAVRRPSSTCRHVGLFTDAASCLSSATTESLFECDFKLGLMMNPSGFHYDTLLEPKRKIHVFGSQLLLNTTTRCGKHVVLKSSTYEEDGSNALYFLYITVDILNKPRSQLFVWMPPWLTIDRRHNLWVGRTADGNIHSQPNAAAMSRFSCRLCVWEGRAVL